MDFTPRPLALSSAELEGLSERLLASHHANNYTGAVKRLNAIRAQLQALEFTSAPGFQLNGLKREELIATNSIVGAPSLSPWARRSAEARAGCC